MQAAVPRPLRGVRVLQNVHCANGFTAAEEHQSYQWRRLLSRMLDTASFPEAFTFIWIESGSLLSLKSWSTDTVTV